MNDKTIEVNEISYNILTKMAQIYIAMYVIDIIEDRGYEYKIVETLRPFVESDLGARAKLRSALKNVIAPSHLARALEFTNLDTLNDRMKDKVSISMDYIGIHYGWIRARFIALDYTDDGKLKSVIFTSEIIDDEKKVLEELRKMSFTDPLTKLYNRYAYDHDKLDYNITPDTVVYSIDLNGLKVTNDHFGHDAGDELLKGLAECLTNVFAICGKAYRIGGDEFVVIAETKNPEGLKERINVFNESWSDGKEFTLACAVGFASGEDSIECMMTVADTNMYKDKALYYKNKQK